MASEVISPIQPQIFHPSAGILGIHRIGIPLIRKTTSSLVPEMLNVDTKLNIISYTNPKTLKIFNITSSPQTNEQS